MQRFALPFLALAVGLFAAPSSQAETLSAFAVPPIGDSALGAVHGAGFGRRERARIMADDTQAGSFRDMADISRIVMDNWWAQTGAALVANNLLAR